MIQRWRGPLGPAISDYLDELRALVEGALARALSDPHPPHAPAVVMDAMRYSLNAGGKRLRPVLALAAADAIAEARGTSMTNARALAMPVAAALELIHTYSLIHDDLPAMDDDTLRRGRPTSHVVFGDGLAILAGDGLLTEAFALLTEPGASRVAPDGPWADAATRLGIVFVIARAAGAAGMVGGQAIDLHAAGKTPGTVRHTRSLDAESLKDMHLRKTGALIQASVVAGGIAAGADEEIAALGQYGEEIGLAFQIVDDLLDVEGTDAALGKTAGKDAAAGKPTYPALYGLDESRRLAEGCIERATTAVAGLGGRLADIARVVIERKS